MNVLWYDDESSCLHDIDVIDFNFRFIASHNGYTMNNGGNIVGKDNTGKDDATGAKTTTWDNPHYDDITGKWWISNPEFLRFTPEGIAVIMNGVTGTKGTYEYPASSEDT